jgi:hypothetical protein
VGHTPVDIAEPACDPLEQIRTDRCKCPPPTGALPL